MKMSDGVEWALHCCVALTTSSRPVPAARLAELHDVSGSYLAKQLQSLARAGLVHSVQGKSGGYALTRPPESITFLDVVEAIDGPTAAFVCTEIRQRGPLGAPAEACTTPCAIARAMGSADRAWRQALAAITIADIVHDTNTGAGPHFLTAVGDWLTDNKAT